MSALIVCVVFSTDGPTLEELVQQMVLPALIWLMVWAVLALVVARSSHRKLVMGASLSGFGLTWVFSGLLFVMGGPRLLLLCCWVVIGPLTLALSASRRGRFLRDQSWF